MKENKKFFIFLFCLITFNLTFVSSELNIGEDSISNGVSINSGVFTNNNMSFINLTDTPLSYSGQGGLCVKVGVGEKALEFGNCGGSSGNPFDQSLNTTDDVTFNNLYLTGKETIHKNDANVFLVEKEDGTNVFKVNTNAGNVKSRSISPPSAGEDLGIFGGDVWRDINLYGNIINSGDLDLFPNGQTTIGLRIYNDTSLHLQALGSNKISFEDDLVPKLTKTYNLGLPSLLWNNLQVFYINATKIDTKNITAININATKIDTTNITTANINATNGTIGGWNFYIDINGNGIIEFVG